MERKHQSYLSDWTKAGEAGGALRGSDVSCPGSQELQTWALCFVFWTTVPPPLWLLPRLVLLLFSGLASAITGKESLFSRLQSILTQEPSPFEQYFKQEFPYLLHFCLVQEKRKKGWVALLRKWCSTVIRHVGTMHNNILKMLTALQ